MSVIVFNLVEPFIGKGLVAEERFKNYPRLLNVSVLPRKQLQS
jgi:hypothetical protein